jgi:glutamine synthetase
MHIHTSVMGKDGNIFNDADGKETAAFTNYIGGLQRFLPGVIPMIAPYVNSYRRFTGGGSAPTNLEWGRDNRTTGLRVPVSEPGARRIENRIAGMDCNPYLAIAASLACGLKGLLEETRPRRQFKGEFDEDKYTLPRGLLEALETFDTANKVDDILGPEFCTVFSAIKRLEIEEFHQVISPWEREHLLTNV